MSVFEDTLTSTLDWGSVMGTEPCVKLGGTRTAFGKELCCWVLMAHAEECSHLTKNRQMLFLRHGAKHQSKGGHHRSTNR